MKWCLKNVYQLDISYGFIISVKHGPLKCTFKLHFQILALPDIKLIFGRNFLSYGCDIHFADSEDLFELMHKIKFAKSYSHAEKTYFKYACDVSLFVQYI